MAATASASASATRPARRTASAAASAASATTGARPPFPFELLNRLCPTSATHGMLRISWQAVQQGHFLCNVLAGPFPVQTARCGCCVRRSAKRHREDDRERHRDDERGGSGRRRERDLA